MKRLVPVGPPSSAAPPSAIARSPAPRRDEIRIARVDVRCIIGVLAAERGTPQTLGLDARLWLDLSVAGASGALDATLDYAQLTRELRFLLQAGRFRLLETAALAALAWLLTPRGAVRAAAAAVKLTKPEALGGDGIPSVHLRRTADELPAPARSGGALTPPVGALLVFSGAGSIVYLLAAATAQPGATPATDAVLDLGVAGWLGVRAAPG